MTGSLPDQSSTGGSNPCAQDHPDENWKNGPPEEQASHHPQRAARDRAGTLPDPGVAQVAVQPATQAVTRLPASQQPAGGAAQGNQQGQGSGFTRGMSGRCECDCWQDPRGGAQAASNREALENPRASPGSYGPPGRRPVKRIYLYFRLGGRWAPRG
jgi:hypothetical protein